MAIGLSRMRTAVAVVPLQIVHVSRNIYSRLPVASIVIDQSLVKGVLGRAHGYEFFTVSPPSLTLLI